jgi:hypothetical protein
VGWLTCAAINVVLNNKQIGEQQTTMFATTAHPVDGICTNIDASTSEPTPNCDRNIRVETKHTAGQEANKQRCRHH